MPLTLRDLTPILTPYSKPVGIDLSGYASNIIANRQLDEARVTADQTNETTQARDAETARKNAAEEQAAREAAEAAAARQRWEDQQKAIALAPSGIDPSKEASVAGAILSSGLSLAPEGKMQGELAAPPSPQLQAPSAELGQQPAQQQPGLTYRDEPGQYTEQSLMREAPGLRVPMLDDNMSKFGLGAGELQAPTAAPAALGTAQIEDTGKGIYNEQGQRVGRFDPAQARDRAKLFVDNYFAQLERNANPIDAQNARQAHEAVLRALPAVGYDADAALSFVLKEQYTPRMGQEHADWRNASRAEATTGRIGATQSRLLYDMGRKYAQQEMQTKYKTGDLIRGKERGSRALEVLDEAVATGRMNSVELASIIYELAHLNDPGARVTDKDFDITAGVSGIEQATADQIEKMISGSMSQGHIQKIRDAIARKLDHYDVSAVAQMEALKEYRDTMPHPLVAKGIDDSLSAYSSFGPLYDAFRQEDARANEMRGLTIGADVGQGSSFSTSSSRRGGPAHEQGGARPAPPPMAMPEAQATIDELKALGILSGGAQ